MRKCEHCGKEYKSVATHWNHNPSHRPSLTKKQKDILTGVMMSDGTLMKTNKNARIKIDMITKEYLKYIQKMFGSMASDITVARTKKEQKEKIDNFADGDYNTNTMYRIIIGGATEINKFRTWYSSGEKIWPSDIELTPTVLKHLYCGDGCWSNKGKANEINIGMGNEIKNKEKIKYMFVSKSLPKPRFTDYKNQFENMGCNMRFTRKDSEKIWKYMGTPIPGFEYKWPEKYS